MTILWWVLIALFLSLGFLGCFINKVPGPIAVLIATVIAVLGLEIPIEWSTVGIIAALAVASMLASKVLVSLLKKLHDFSKRASWGTTIGSIIGLCIVASAGGEASVGMEATLLLLGFIVIPFVLSFLLELTNRNDMITTLKSAGSATLVFLTDTCLKLVVFVYAIYVIFQIG